MSSPRQNTSHREIPPNPPQEAEENLWRDRIIMLMMVAAVIDFGGGFGLRDLSIVLGLAYVVVNYRHLQVRSTEFVGLFLLFLLVPLWSVLVGLMAGGNLFVAQSQVSPFVIGVIYFFLLSHGGSRYAIDIFFKALAALAAFSSVMIIYGAIAPGSPVIELFIDIMRTENDIHGKFGLRALAGFEFYSIYFKATLFYVAGFIYALYREKWGLTGLFFLALFLTVSKSGIALCAVFAVWYALTTSSWKRRLILVSAILLLSMLTVSFVDLKIVSGYVDYLSATFRGEATTSKVRIGHWKSFVDLMKENPSYLIWGQGTGTQFVSLGEAARGAGIPHAVYNIELDHVDSIRQFGLLWFIGFTACTVYVSLKLIWIRNNDKAKGLGYAMVGLYIAAGTNPVLITPLFMMLLVAYYHYVDGINY